MSEFNSKIYLAKNIKLDKEYNNVLSYSVNQMLNLVNSNLVAYSDNYSFIRNESNTISTNFTYAQCLQSNYLCFQNTDFNGKYFFGWIDEVEYISDACTNIKYTIDVFSTFYDDWKRTTTYVLREHPENDEIGANTIPEALEIGSTYVNYSTTNYSFSDTNSHMNFGVFVSGSPNKDNPSYLDINNFNGIINGIHSILGIPVTDTNAIRSILKEYIENGVENRIVKTFQYSSKLGDAASAAHIYQDTISIAKPIIFEHYIPKNNKLFTFPFVKLIVYSYTGESLELQIENFKSERCDFKINGALLPTCEFKITPKKYLNEDFNYSKSLIASGEIEVPFTGSAYQQFIANNKISTAIQIGSTAISAIGQIGAGVVTGNPALIASGTISGISSGAKLANDYEKAKNSSSAVHGSLNGSGIALNDGTFGFTICIQTIKEEYAKLIDDYFSRYGYAVMRLKVANITSRPYFNYVKISENSIIGTGNIPTIYMNTINNIFRKGVTLWHSHDVLGDYSVDNSI